MILIQQNYQINPNEREESISWFGIAYIKRSNMLYFIQLELDIFTEFDAGYRATDHQMTYSDREPEGLKALVD